LSLIRTTAMVVRDGKPREVPLAEIVPGDIVQLSAGSSAPGDAVLLEVNDLFVDQAALTGESYPAEKSTVVAPANAELTDRTNALYLGTHVISGTATALVMRTGASTMFGEIAQRLAQHPPETEFEIGVRHFGYLLLQITTVFAIVIFSVNVALHRPVLDALLFTLALSVGLTPQLLPAIVSVTLAHGARRMSEQRVIVRRLASIEDLGGMEILCTDKTGTLTEGVVAVNAAEDWTGAPSERVRLFCYLNAAFETGLANPIDDALRAAPPPDAARYTKRDEIPYDFIRKRLSVAVNAGDKQLLLTKGALTAVLDACDRAEDANGQVVPLDQVRAAITARYEALSRDGFRCLGVAYREIGQGPIDRATESGLIFLGILSLADPLKSHARQILAELGTLGIRVKLITGDNRHVAAHIAAQAGFDTSTVLSGSDLRTMTEDALVAVAPKVGVFAEIEPNQKERIILALKKTGVAVGYIGDGINDASALHAADVGISVDSATDVTKQAADVVLLDKDLRVLAAGVREGRAAFANTLKYVFITTSASFGNMFSMAGASLFAAFLPLLPKQILLINVLTDLPAMSLASDRLDPELVEKPRRWDNRNIRRFMLAFGLVSSLFDFLTFGTLLAMHVSPPIFRTAWFVESVLSEIFVLLVIRTRRAFFQSRVGPALLWTSVAVGASAILLSYTPLSGVLGFAPLPPSLLGIVVGIVALYVVGSEVSKRALLRHVSL
jgi:Mg2+-importing ATPase